MLPLFYTVAYFPSKQATLVRSILKQNKKVNLIHLDFSVEVGVLRPLFGPGFFPLWSKYRMIKTCLLLDDVRLLEHC